jgi:hypothetical protein
MGPDAPPDDVRLAFSDRVAVLKRGPSVVIPGQLEDAGGALDAFDSETLAETTAALKILDNLSDRGQKSWLLSRCESVKVLGEAGQPRARRQRFAMTTVDCGV